MKSFEKFFVFVLLLMFLVPSVCLSAGLPFFKLKPMDRESLPLVLGFSIEISLYVDPTGNEPLSGMVCTTPNMFLETIQEHHPSAELRDVEYLPAYIKGLASRPAQQGENYTLTRVDKNGEECGVGIWERKFYDDELVWVDLSTGEEILSGYCSNVIVPKFSPDVEVLSTQHKNRPAQQEVNNTSFEFCSEYVAGQNEKPVAPFRVCSATEFVELRYPDEMVPVVYGICDAMGRSVYSRDVQIVMKDRSEGGANLVQKNLGLNLNRSEGCTQVLVKRGRDYETLDPFKSDETNGAKNELYLFARGVSEVIEPLTIPWEVDVKDISLNEKPILSVQQSDEGVIARVVTQSGNFPVGVLRLIVQKGRREVVLVRTNLREIQTGFQYFGVYDFGKLPKGNYLITFSQAEERMGNIYLNEKKAIEIEVK